MDSVAARSFLKAFVTAMDEQAAAVFCGAGISRASGFVEWKGLLRDIAIELGLEVERESDLISLAQYHLNHTRSRAVINRQIIQQFGEQAEPNANHALIAALPINTIWTTNYDSLIEDGLRKAKRRVDVKSTPSSLAVTVPNRDITVYKMHGDISDPATAVVTREDYELYESTRSGFITQLRADLLAKTFLFVGFSFTDPNIEYVLARVRALHGESIRQHFCIMKKSHISEEASADEKADFDYEQRRTALRIDDLKRYGIATILVDSHDDLTTLLEDLVHRSRRKFVFLSGSAHSYGDFGQKRMEDLTAALGRRLYTEGLNLVSGFGLGIGGSAIMGFFEAGFGEDASGLAHRAILRPFPQAASQDDIEKVKAFWKNYREEMIGLSGFAVFVAGNKLEGNTIVPASGVRQEFDTAMRLGRLPIPVGATGFVAEDIYNEVVPRLRELYGTVDVVEPFKVLGSKDATNERLVDAVASIIKAVRAQ